MNRSYFRQWGQLSAIWVLITLVPIGRSLLNDLFPFQIGFNLTILFLGLLLAPLFIWWFNYLQKRKVSWFWMAIIQISFAILLSLWFYYAIQEHPGIVKSRISQAEVSDMHIIQKAGTYLFSGNSYSIFTSLMMLSGFGLLIAYSEQDRLRKLRYQDFQQSYLEEQAKNELGSTRPENADQFQQRKIAVKTGKKYEFINPDEIIYISADGNYCEIQLSSGQHFLHRITITEIFSMLSKEKFMRIHQSHIVCLDAITQIKRIAFGELLVVMVDGQQLKVSRKHKKQVTGLIKS